MASPTTDRRLGLVGNTAIKVPVSVLAAGNITLSGQQTIDGVAVLASNAAGVPDRVLCMGQTDATQNGIWDVSTAAWTRSLDANGNYDFAQGTSVYIARGTTYAGTYWKLDTSGTITIGTTTLSWSRALASALSTLSFLQAGIGAGSRPAQDKMREWVSVTDFYANGVSGALVDPTGVVDSTLGIQAAINSVSPGGEVRFPRGTFKVTSTVTISGMRVHLRGAGMHATQILFVPSIAGVCFSVTAGAAVIYQGSIRDMLFYSSETTLKKTAIKVSDSSGYLVENIAVSGAATDGSSVFWGGAGSVGLQIAGREFGMYRNLYIGADKPVQISDNPNSTIDCDHHHFQDWYLTANGNPCVTVDSGVNISQVTFDGVQAWVKGTYGFYWNDTTSVAVSFGLQFKNVRTEQGTNAAAHQFYISHNAGLQDVGFEGCYGGVDRNGYYFRAVKNVSMKTCHYIGAAGKTCIDAVAPAGGVLTLDNTIFEVGSTASLSGYRQQKASPNYVAGSPLPTCALYYYQSTSITDYNVENGVRTLKFTGTLANGATLNLLCGANQGVTVAHISVVAVGATKSAAGQAGVTTTGGTGTAYLTGGSALFNVGNVAGSLTVFAAAATQLFNQLGESVTYVAEVTCF